MEEVVEVVEYTNSDFLREIESLANPVLILGQNTEVYVVNKLSTELFGTKGGHSGHVRLPALLLSDWGRRNDKKSFCSLIAESEKVRSRIFAVGNVNFVSMQGKFCKGVGVASRMKYAGNLCFFIQILIDKRFDDTTNSPHDFVSSEKSLLHPGSFSVVATARGWNEESMQGGYKQKSLALRLPDDQTKAFRKKSLARSSTDSNFGLRRSTSFQQISTSYPTLPVNSKKKAEKADNHGALSMEIDSRITEFRMLLKDSYRESILSENDYRTISGLIVDVESCSRRIQNYNLNTTNNVRKMIEENKVYTHEKLAALEAHLQRRLAAIDTEKEKVREFGQENKYLVRAFNDFRLNFVGKLDAMDMRKLEQLL